MKKKPEPIILAVALVCLALAAAALAVTFPSAQDITGVPSTSPTGKTPPKLKEADLDASLAPWQTPAEWPESTRHIFLSEQFLFYPDQYPDGDYIKKVDPKSRTPSGVLISWYQKYGIDFTDANVDREDPDNDGFSNIVEFKNDEAKAAEANGDKSTNPLDPLSHPTYLSRLRLQKYDSRPFHIQFRGYQELGGIEEFQIFLKDVPSYEQPGLKKTGDPLNFEGYIVGAFHQKTVTQVDEATHTSTDVDVSTLALEKPDIGFEIVLTFRQEVDSPESTADFVMLMPTEVDKVIKVSRGKMFSPPFVKETYLVISASNTGAVIRNLQTKQDLNVPLLDPGEWNEVPTSGPTKSPSTPASP